MSEDHDCAAVLIETVLLGMRNIRAAMRGAKPGDLSVPQFRVLMFIVQRKGASLSDAAEHIGLSLPAMSRIVDGLVRRGLVVREVSAEDRRRIMLSITEAGRQVIEAAHGAAQARIARMLGSLPNEQRKEVAGAVEALRSMFASSRADSKDLELK